MENLNNKFLNCFFFFKFNLQFNSRILCDSLRYSNKIIIFFYYLNRSNSSLQDEFVIKKYFKPIKLAHDCSWSHALSMLSHL